MTIKEFKLLKLDPTKLYICVVERSSGILPSDLLLPKGSPRMKIPIIYVQDADSIKLVEVTENYERRLKRIPKD